MRVIKPAGGKSGGRAVALRAQSSGRVFSGGSAPWLEEVEFKRLVVLMALGAAAISSWLLTAATVRIPELPPDAFFYVHQLPSIYWLGLISTFALFAYETLSRTAQGLSWRFRLFFSSQCTCSRFHPSYTK